MFGDSISAAHRLFSGVVLLLILIGIGTIGYMLIEGWSLLDALYMTVTTVTTVGFREVQPLTTAGRIFTIFVILLGVGVALYLLVGVVTLIIEGELQKALGVRRMRSKIQALHDHQILCGFGRVGEEIGRELKERGIPFVVVESNPEAVERARMQRYLLIEGDASQDAVLVEAGIKRARGLLAASDSDSGNTYITLTAKAMHPEMLVVARAGKPANIEKMRRAGADRVISPYLIGGRRMALSALQPLVMDFIDNLVAERSGEFMIAEMEASESAGLSERTLRDILSGCTGAVVLAIQKPSGETVVGPADSSVVQDGDRLIVMGKESDLESLCDGGAKAVPS
jgi:voltage-gated potassium channel